MELTELQRRAVTSIDSHVFVSAGAGSGKTRVLVERIIASLDSSVAASTSQILAVTYTRKAAGEMLTRLKKEIQKRARDPEQKDRQKWNQHLAEMDMAKIGTIHSLCESILKSFAFQARLEPEFEQLDDISRATLQDISAKSALLQAISEQTEEHELLLKYPWEVLHEWLELVLRSPLRYLEATKTFDYLDKELFQTHLQKLLRTVQMRSLRKFLSNPVIRELHASLNSLADTDKITNLGDFRKQALLRLNTLTQSVDVALDDNILTDLWKSVLALAEESVGNRGSRNDEANLLKAKLKAAKEMAEACCGKKADFQIPAEINEADLEIWHPTRLLMLLAQRGLAIYENNKLSKGVDYDDLIGKAVNALAEEESNIKAHYQRSIAHILVDEFQDTNFLQANLISALAGQQTKLFLIGDEKQSIYKFQGSEIAHFNAWRNDFLSDGKDSTVRVSNLPRLVIELSESFRSHPKIVHFFNAVFEKLFFKDSKAAPYYAAYVPLAPITEPVGNDASERVEVIECFGDTAQESEGSEAKAIEEWIKQTVQSELPIRGDDGSIRSLGYGDIAILLQNNDMFESIEKTLSRAEIPYVRLGGQGFLERQEVYDIENLLDFLHNPGDCHALIGLLRAPFCALPDDLIHALFAGTKEPTWEVLEDAARENREGYQLVARACSLLRRFREYSHYLTLPQLLRKFIQATSYDLTLMEMQNGRQRSRNLWKLVDMAVHHQEMTCGEFSQQLKKMRKLAVKEKDAPVDAKNSVKLMTIHAAKGLEFPAVLLPRLAKSGQPKMRKFLFHKDYALAFDDTRFGGEAKPLYYQLASWLEQDMEQAERQRLLYVAMTRARDYLTIFLAAGRNRNSFARWLNKIIFKPDQMGKDTDPDQPVTLQVPNSNATFLFRNTGSAETAPLEAKTIPPSTVFDETPPALDEGGNGARTGLVTPHIDYALIEPVHSEPCALPNNSLDMTRISPRNNLVTLSPILVGNYFHALLERLAAGENKCDQQFLHNVALLQGTAVAHPKVLSLLVAEGERLLCIFFASELFEIIGRAKACHHELPYSIFLEQRLETKRPDLLIQKLDRSWHVIDYKTDSFPQSEVAKQAANHRDQLQNYASEISQLTGRTVSPHIYFAQHGLIFPL